MLPLALKFDLESMIATSVLIDRSDAIIKRHRQEAFQKLDPDKMPRLTLPKRKSPFEELSLDYNFNDEELRRIIDEKFYERTKDLWFNALLCSMKGYRYGNS